MYYAGLRVQKEFEIHVLFGGTEINEEVSLNMKQSFHQYFRSLGHVFPIDLSITPIY
jgi:phosphosulfolactate synthase (CoM biosynthesis protein A)